MAFLSPNHEPIFIICPLHWDAELGTQTFPRTGGPIGATSPVLLGKAGDNGGVISSIYIESTGDSNSNVCALYTLRNGATIARKRGEAAIPQRFNTTGNAIVPQIRFILPDTEPFEGGIVNLLKLEPRESLYCALVLVDPSNTFIIHAVGGLYDKAET